MPQRTDMDDYGHWPDVEDRAMEKQREYHAPPEIGPHRFDSRIIRLENQLSIGVSKKDSLSMLKNMYENPEIPIVKHLAGRALTRTGHNNYNYSSTRIFLHEHPVATTITAVTAGAGAVTGLVYILVQLNK